MLCLDNDANNQTDQLIHLAAEKLQEQGKSVMISQPKTEGWDFNDILVREGLSAVKAELQQAIPYAKYQSKANLEMSTVMREERSASINKNPLPTKETTKIERSFELEI